MKRQGVTIGFLVLIGIAGAATFAYGDPAMLEGASATSVGRFGWWPEIWSGDSRTGTPATVTVYKLDEGLVERVNFSGLDGGTLGLQRTVRVPAPVPYQTVWGLKLFPVDEPVAASPVVESVDVLSVNWVRKSVGVRLQGDSFEGEDDYSYKISYNTVSPGVLLETEKPWLFLQGAGTMRLARMAWMAEAGLFVTEDPNFVYDRDTGNVTQILAENWILLWFDDDAAYQVPVLLTLAQPPDRIELNSDGVFVTYGEGAGNSLFVVSLPFGAETLAPDDVAAWTGEEAKGKGAKKSIEPALPVEHCRLMSRLTSQWPAVVQEYFWIDRENGRVEIEDHFTYRIIGSGWGTTVEAFAPIPPVVSLARDMGMAVTTDGNTRIDDAGYPTKYGPLRFVPNSAVSRWQIPLPPEHTLSFVGTTTPDPDWRWAVDHQIDLWTTEQNFWWPCSYGFGPLNQIGLYSTLGMAAPDLRARFLDRAREVIDLRAWSFEPDDDVDDRCLYYDANTPRPAVWREFERCAGACEDLAREECEALVCPPATGTCEEAVGNECSTDPFEEYEFIYQLFPSIPDSSADGDAFSGMALEFLYSYAAWSGDWSLIADNWPKVEAIYEYLERINDWAYLASSARPWGGVTGSSIDMFAAQYLGYVTYARMADVVKERYEPADPEYQALVKRRDAALYFAARAQIPLVLRFPFRDYASRYYILKEHEFISGFAEGEPATSAGRLWGASGHPVDSVLHWVDFSISGERIHPLVYDAYRVIGDYKLQGVEGNYFQEFLDWGIGINSDPDNPNREIVACEGEPFNFASFPEDKIYAFWRLGQYAERDDLAATVLEMYTPRLASELECLTFDGTKMVAADQEAAIVEEFRAREEIGGPLQWYMKVPWGTSPRILQAPKNAPDPDLYTVDDLYPKTRFPILPGIVEAYNVPVELGSWAPARLAGAAYDIATGTLHATLDPPQDPDYGTSASLRLVVAGMPDVVRVNGLVSPILDGDFDPYWSTLTIPLYAPGPWDVQVLIPPVGVVPSPLPPVSEWPPWAVPLFPNLVLNPGFEDCGDRANVEMAWSLGGWMAPYNPPRAETGIVQEGNVSMRLEVPENRISSIASQHVFVGEDPYRIRLHYRIPDALPAGDSNSIQFLAYIWEMNDRARDRHTCYNMDECNEHVLVKRLGGESTGEDWVEVVWPGGEEYHDPNGGCPAPGAASDDCSNVWIILYLLNTTGEPAVVYVDDVRIEPEQDF